KMRSHRLQCTLRSRKGRVSASLRRLLPQGRQTRRLPATERTQCLCLTDQGSVDTRISALAPRSSPVVRTRQQTGVFDEAGTAAEHCSPVVEATRPLHSLSRSRTRIASANAAESDQKTAVPHIGG